MKASSEYTYKENTKKRIEKEFKEKGFSDVGVSVSTANGHSVYINISLKVIDAKKLFRGMQPCEHGYVSVQIRMSDHLSGLEKNCGGYNAGTLGIKMTMPIFEALIRSGAVQATN